MERMAMAWDLETPAVKLAEKLWMNGEQKLPPEVLKLTEDTAGIVVDIDGVDYMLTMTRVPNQRLRPAIQ
jgi:hypothetical protein